MQIAYNTVTGSALERDEGSETHPAPRDRASAILSAFRQHFDVSYNTDHTFRLQFWLRSPADIPEPHGFTREHAERAYDFANVLWLIWKRARQRLQEDFRQEHPLHPLWQ